MDEVRVVRRRTYVWPVVIAVIILALVIAWAFFSMGGTPTDVDHLEIQSRTRFLEDPERRIHDLWTDAVAVRDGNGPIRHSHLSWPWTLKAGAGTPSWRTLASSPGTADCTLNGTRVQARGGREET